MATNPASSASAPLTLPTIIHYLQTESQKYERDRNYWQLERAEMKARIAKLEGERKATDRMNVWYERRLRMLEQALHEERLKNDPDAEPVHPSTTADQVQKRSKQDKSSALEQDDAYMDIIRASQEVLQDQIGRKKSKTYLEKCLLEVTYLVSSFPTISANQPANPQNGNRHTSSPPREGGPLPHLPAPRLMRNDPVDRASTPNIDALPVSTSHNGNSAYTLGRSVAEDLNASSGDPIIDTEDNVEQIQHTFDSNGNYVEPLSEQDTDPGMLGKLDFTEASSEWYQDDRWDFSHMKTDDVVMPLLSYPCSMKNLTALCVFTLADAIFMVVAGSDGQISITKDFDARSTMMLEDDQGRVTCLTYGRLDHQRKTAELFSAGSDLVIRRWILHLDSDDTLYVNRETKPTTTYISHSLPVSGMIFFDNCLVSASRDSSVRKWNIDTGEGLGVWWPQEKDKELVPLSICRTGNTTFIVGFKDGQLRSFDCADDLTCSFLRSPATLDHSATASGAAIKCLGLIGSDPMQSLLIGAGELYTQPLSKGNPAILDARPVTSLCQGTRLIVSGHASGQIALWSHMGEKLQSIDIGTEHEVAGLACIEKDAGPSPLVIAACRDGTIQIFGGRGNLDISTG